MTNNFKVPHFDSEFSPVDMFSEEDEEEMVKSKPADMELNGDAAEDRVEGEDREGDDNADEDEDGDEFNDADSGAGSDDFDLLELGESGTEFCQIESVTCSLPFDLYDLPGLEQVLSIDVWNKLLTNEEKFELTKLLPDMDQVNFTLTLKELFEGANFHFGSPLKKLFQMLKGGLCEPRVTLYREGLSLFQKRRHYLKLRNHHNSMVYNMCQMRDTLHKLKGYSIEEKLRFLNIVKNQKISIRDNVEDGFGSDSLEESGDVFQGKRVKGRRSTQKLNRISGYGVPKQTWRIPSYESAKHEKGILKLSDVNSVDKNLPLYDGLRMSPLVVRKVSAGNDTRGKIRLDCEDDETFVAGGMKNSKSAIWKGSKKAAHVSNEADYSGSYEDCRETNMLEMKNYRARSGSYENELEKTVMYSEMLHQYPVVDQIRSVRGRAMQIPLLNGRFGLPYSDDPKGRGSPDINFHRYRSTSPQTNDAVLISDLKAKHSKGKYIKGLPNGGSKKSTLKVMYPKNDETESDSSEYFDNEDKDDVVFAKKKSGSDARRMKFFAKKVHEEEVDLSGNSSRGKTKGMNQKGGKIAHLKIELDINSPSVSRLQSSDRKRKAGLVKRDSVSEFETNLDEQPPIKTMKRGHKADHFMNNRAERSDPSLQGCSSTTKKQRKVKEVEPMEIDGRDDDGEAPFPHLQTDDFVPVKKKGKRKLEPDNISPDAESFQPQTSEGGTPTPVLESEAKPVKKPYTPITPSVHTDFSFSVVHLLTSVRLALITEELKESNEDISASLESENVHQNNLSKFTTPQIVSKVKSNPCDPLILETQEPLHDLVRGALKIFASKTAPLGAKGWKPMVRYEKSSKSWLWVGPLADSSTDLENNEATSPEHWGVTHKMLVKIVDSFANWLKCGHQTLQQIGSLPAPPLSLMQCNLDEKERFRDLRAQKSLNTFSPSPEEVRSYFRKEEFLRYSVPDRAFSYTAADGKKSIVAPLRRCGGKPTSKARDHFMLKRDRPPHVTILCLVRDAAARLPGSIGTRADVCTLIRDSQYIVEDVADAQVNQVVSGALDRLHYERDPCVQFDSERKLWVYLHREREEEDFEDDGTSSTKKWKRQKKDSNDPESGPVVGFDLGSDLNTEPVKNGVADDGADADADEMKPCVGDDNVNTSHEFGNTLGDPLRWETLNLNPQSEGELLCQENSTNEDFGDDSFGRNSRVELLSGSLS